MKYQNLNFKSQNHNLNVKTDLKIIGYKEITVLNYKVMVPTFKI